VHEQAKPGSSAKKICENRIQTEVHGDKKNHTLMNDLNMHIQVYHCVWEGKVILGYKSIYIWWKVRAGSEIWNL
jgi:hypothetical protein